MNYAVFLGRIINDGIEAVNLDYADKTNHRSGAVRGFEECRGLFPKDIKRLLVEANERCQQARRDRADDYWYWRCRAAEIEWVANVISAANMHNNLPMIITPTARGAAKAAEILGVAPAS